MNISIFESEEQTGKVVSQRVGRAKMAVVGASGVGKTSLLNVEREWDDEVSPTIFVEHLLLQLHGEEYGESCKLKADVFDMAGSHKFIDFVEIYIREADSVLLVFESWEDVQYLMRAMKDVRLSPNQHLTLVHSKQDIRADLTPEEIFELVTYFKPQLYTRTSTSNPNTIKRMFYKITQYLIESGSTFNDVKGIELENSSVSHSFCCTE